MKKILLLFIIVLLIVLGFYFYLPRKPILDFGSDKFKDYEIISIQYFKTADNHQFVIVGYNRNLTPPINPKELLSVLAVYQFFTPLKAKLVYQYTPILLSNDYPSPLQLEKVSVVESNKNDLILVTSWGETGADYFGSFPIIISYANNHFQAVNFYQDKLIDRPEIKPWALNMPDVKIKNYYKSGNQVQSILTQGIFLTANNNLELKFYGDDSPKADNHKYVVLPFIITN